MIQLNDFGREYGDIGQELLACADVVLKSGYYVLGEFVASFEKDLANYWHLPWAVGCGNGLDAIEIGLRVAGLKAGEKVLTTPLSAFATTLAIIRAGGTPVFVDVDVNGNLDLDLAEAALSADASIRYMVPVHLYGIPLDLNRLTRIKKKFHIIIVEDCAQAIGALFDNQAVGSVGEMAAVSFYPTKNLGAIGDGGAILGKSESFRRRAMSLRNYGQSSRYVHEVLGMNSRLDELHAAMLDYILKYQLGKYITRRKEIAATYLKRIKNSLIKLPSIDSACQPVWHLFPIIVSGDRQKFMDYCKQNNIQTAVHYPVLITDQKALSSVRFEIYGTLKQARFMANHEVSIPIHPYLTEQEVECVIQTLCFYT